MTLPLKNQFEAHASDDFLISFLNDKSLPCQINEIKTGLKPADDSLNEQFSMVFACQEQQVFEQGVYKVSHSKLGEFELFLVPIFGDDKGVHYEAIFT